MKRRSAKVRSVELEQINVKFIQTSADSLTNPCGEGRIARMEDEPGSAPSLRASNRLRVIQALQLLGVTSRADLCAPYRPVALDRVHDRRRPPGRGHGRGPRRRRAPRRRRPPARADRARPVGRLRDRHRLRQAPPRGRARGPLAPAARRGVARDDGRLRRRDRHRAGGRAGGGRARGGRRGRGPAARAWAWACPGRCTAAASSAPRRSCRAGPGTHAARAHGRAARPWRSGSATTRTSARSPSPPGAPGATPAASSTSSSRRASAPAS